MSRPIPTVLFDKAVEGCKLQCSSGKFVDPVTTSGATGGLEPTAYMQACSNIAAQRSARIEG
jgi:hypothetical protein